MPRFYTAMLLGAIAISAAPVQAVMNGGNLDTTDGTGVSGFNNIGLFNNASAVYLGNNWVLTAVHVYNVNPSAPIAFSSTTLTPDVSPPPADAPHILTNPDTSNSDLILVHVSGDISTLSNIASLATTAPAAGQPITIVGEGVGRSTPNPSSDPELFYSVTGPSNNPTWTPVGSAATANAGGFNYQTAAKRWGNSSVANEDNNNSNPVVFLDPTSNSFGFESFFYNDLTDFTNSDKSGAGIGTVADGDSGGGVFSGNTLLGINDEKVIFINQPANTALFGNGSFFVDISSYESQIETVTGVPEPTLLSAVGAGFLFMNRRRSKTSR